MIPNVPIPPDPALLDLAIGEMQVILKDNLSWLDYSFGAAQKLIKIENGTTKYFPAIPWTNRKYENMLPDSRFGNYSFFKIDDPEKVLDFKLLQYNRIAVDFSLIFWFNLDTITNLDQYRRIEDVKSEILAMLSRKTIIKHGRLSNISNIYKEAKNIYRGYDISEVNSQFLMQPYAGLRFEGELIIKESCR